MSTAAPILVVDDDPSVLEVVRFALEKAGWTVVTAADGDEALEAAGRHAPQLIVLDINMPERSGTDVCRELRKTSTVPIVFLSSADDEVDRIVGLELGGDDYVTKPFSPRELVARVRAVLRRVSRPAPPAGDSAVLRAGALTLDTDRCEVRLADAVVALTATELALLQTLMRRPGKVYSRDELMTRAYDGTTWVSDRTIDSHIRRVRQKLDAAGGGGELVETVRGLGYRLRG